MSPPVAPQFEPLHPAQDGTSWRACRECVEGGGAGVTLYPVKVFYILLRVYPLPPQSASVTLRVRSAPCATQTAASASVAPTWSGGTATRAPRPPSTSAPTAAEVRDPPSRNA